MIGRPSGLRCDSILASHPDQRVRGYRSQAELASLQAGPYRRTPVRSALPLDTKVGEPYPGVVRGLARTADRDIDRRRQTASRGSSIEFLRLQLCHRRVTCRGACSADKAGRGGPSGPETGLGPHQECVRSVAVSLPCRPRQLAANTDEKARRRGCPALPSQVPRRYVGEADRRRNHPHCESANLP